MLKASLLNSASEGRDHVLYFPETDTGLTVADCGREMKENEVQVVGLSSSCRLDSLLELTPLSISGFLTRCVNLSRFSLHTVA